MNNATKTDAVKMRRFRKAAATVFVIGVATVVLIHIESREPSYEGKTLTEWLHLVEREGDIYKSYLKTNYLAGLAIQQMGSDAVPHLMDHLKPISPLREKVNSLLISSGLDERRILRAEYSWAAAHSMAFLGPAAESAIPELSEMLKRDKLSESVVAGRALAKIRPEGVNCLIENLTSDDAGIRSAAILGLYSCRYPRARQVSSVLDQLCDPRLRGNALAALGHFRHESSQAIPALIDALESEKVGNRMVAALSLRLYDLYEYDVTAAIPALVRSTSSTNQAMRFVAIGVINHIDYRALAQVDESDVDEFERLVATGRDPFVLYRDDW
ncbi:MAG: hypothetical protein ACI8V5_000488 [Limisphaerales bacterium]|jgi:hypothetical protein